MSIYSLKPFLLSLSLYQQFEYVKAKFETVLKRINKRHLHSTREVIQRQMDLIYVFVTEIK